MTPMNADVALRTRKLGKYFVNEVFYSVQGEGILAGTPMVFIRFGDCNLRCSKNNSAGFDCDTEFMSGRELGLDQIDTAIIQATKGVSTSSPSHPRWLLLTGGEPLLQVDREFLEYFHKGWDIAIETNGTIPFPEGVFDVSRRAVHVCVSPKSAEHTLRMTRAAEVKYVRHAGQSIPQTAIKCDHQLISPAAQADGSFRREDLEWCIDLVKENPAWRLSIQMHKLLGAR